MPRRLLSSENGQTLLIAVMVAAVLVIGIAVVLMLNDTTNKAQVSHRQRTKASSNVEGGLAEGIQYLSSSEQTWGKALQADFSETPCNMDVVLPAPDGVGYRMYCSTGNMTNPGLQAYQIALTAVGYAGQGAQTRAMRASKAYINKRTLGVDLNTGVHAAAAVQLVRQPEMYGQLNVHWGPIVCLDTNSGSSWSLPQPIDAGRYPRKFSGGGLTGLAYPRSGATMGAGPLTDHKEYFAYVPQSFIPMVNEQYYKSAAEASTSVAPPVSSLTGDTLVPVNCLGGNPSCASYVTADNEVAIFPFAYAPPPGIVIYVNGSAMLPETQMDHVTMIVTKNVTFQLTGGGVDRMLHVPATASNEYPYLGTWPCQGKEGNMVGSAPAYDCDSDDVLTSGGVHFRGFLWVKGNLTVNGPWTMVGSLLVGDPGSSTGGRLIIPSGGTTLTVFYDDYINHAIHMVPIIGTAIKVVPERVFNIAVP